MERDHPHSLQILLCVEDMYFSSFFLSFVERSEKISTKGGFFKFSFKHFTTDALL